MGGISGVCNSNDEGFSITCNKPSNRPMCYKAECDVNGKTVIVRTCGAPAGVPGSTKAISACYDGV